MSRLDDPPFSHEVRLNQLGDGLRRRLEPDSGARDRIARLLDLYALDRFTADVEVKPSIDGWRLSGQISAHAVQTCGITLEPLPVDIEERFVRHLVEATSSDEEGEIDIDIDHDAPDVIENGRIDLGAYVVEQLALSLDPFPRKADAVFVAPEPTAEISPFAALRALKSEADEGEG